MWHVSVCEGEVRDGSAVRTCPRISAWMDFMAFVILFWCTVARKEEKPTRTCCAEDESKQSVPCSYHIRSYLIYVIAVSDNFF